MRSAETPSSIENGVKSAAEWTVAGVAGVLTWQSLVPEVGILWGAVSATVAAVLGKKLTESAIR